MNFVYEGKVRRWSGWTALQELSPYIVVGSYNQITVVLVDDFAELSRSCALWVGVNIGHAQHISADPFICSTSLELKRKQTWFLQKCRVNPVGPYLEVFAAGRGYWRLLALHACSELSSGQHQSLWPCPRTCCPLLPNRLDMWKCGQRGGRRQNQNGLNFGHVRQSANQSEKKETRCASNTRRRFKYHQTNWAIRQLSMITFQRLLSVFLYFKK